MANSEYNKTGLGAFASIAKLDESMDRETTMIPYTVSNIARPLALGMVVMIEEEIMSLVAFSENTLVVKRGCADTIPAPHGAGLICWIFDVSSVGGDRKEWNAGETIGLKVSPYTVAGSVPMELVNPISLTMNFRMSRPYAPAKVMVNGTRWYGALSIDDAVPGLYMSWVHRDRILQADRLIGHDDDSVGPEPGVTYTMRVYHSVTKALVREEVGIVGNAFTYRRAQATHDQGNPSEVVNPTFTLTAARDGLEAWQHYEGTFALTPAYPLDSNYMAFASQVFESPYVMNAQRGVDANGNFAFAVAARPADRMSDTFAMRADDTTPAPSAKYTPWVTLDFRLPELETIINVRSSSLFDGVPLSSALVGMMGLIDGEIVRVTRVISDKQIEVARGCADTVPTAHAAGALAWFFDPTAIPFDTFNHAATDTVTYFIQPGVYGAAIPVAQLPAQSFTHVMRALRPYAPGRIVVAGRPWFEEAQAVIGQSVVISWARRNRVTQGSQLVEHAAADTAPELNQTTRLRFFYTTPPANAGDPPVEHTLRQVDVTALQYAYTYAMAQADGDAAGRALGICGTVVIYCRIMAARDGIESYQSYVAPIRVPSYPC
jgi:hypothetical protein